MKKYDKDIHTYLYTYLLKWTESVTQTFFMSVYMGSQFDALDRKN